MGWVLWVDLSRMKYFKEPLRAELARAYVGGHGLGGRILFDETPRWVGAFDPLNPLVFVTGPVVGTQAPCAGRFTVVTKSPLTGYFGDANAGGYWGPELKFAGYDVIVVKGVASKPLYLYVGDDRVELRDASAYWGMDARSADRAIRSDLGDKAVRVACIGPAGENLVRFAGIMSDEAGRAAARCGVGAVMGFKKLKAIAVKGSLKVPVMSSELLAELSREIITRMMQDERVIYFGKAGTPGSFAALWEIGDVPSYNFRGGEYGGAGSPAVERVGYPGGYSEILANRKTCYVCSIACRRVISVRNGEFKIEEDVEGPEYETLAAFGPNCGITDIRAIAKLNDLCNLYGVDTISAGSTIAFAMECFEQGLLSKDDTGGVELTFGNAAAAIDLLEKICRREGLGAILAEGTRRAAASIGGGASRYAMHCKGQEIAMHDPRAFQSGGVHYACSPTGGRHTEGLTVFHEMNPPASSEIPYPKIASRSSIDGKAELAKLTEDWWAFTAAAGWCNFARFGYGSESTYLRVYAAVTGVELKISEALLIGERIFNLKRCFNFRHGCTKGEDTLPQRLLTEPGNAGNVVRLNEMLKEYYNLRGWDLQTGIPTQDKLSALDLSDLIDKLRLRG